MKFRYKILMACLVAISMNMATALAVTSRNISSISRDYKEELEVYTLAADSDVVYDQWDSLYFLDKDKVKKGKNLATSEFNASNYILEKRVRDYGDTVGVNFRKLWYLQLGVGASQIPPASEAYKMNILTTANIGIGKILNGYNSLRLTADGGIGYFNNSNDLYMRYGGRLEYLFSFSNYIYGYRASRFLDVSSILGVGYYHNDYPSGLSGKQSNTAEAHMGLQFKFFSGPQGYMALEPYAGIGHKNMDLSGTGYWREYDFFYGVNFGFIFYLNNNMSDNELAWYHMKKAFNEFTHEDSVKFAQLRGMHERTPWFVQTTAGALGTSTVKELKFRRTIGHAEQFSVGRWISSRFGLRGSFFSRQSTRQRDPFNLTHESFYGNFTWDKTHIRDNHSIYQGFSFEVMTNLFGFTRNYNWDSPVGATLLFGAGAGTMTNYYTDETSFKQHKTYGDAYSRVQDINRSLYTPDFDIHKDVQSAEQYTVGLQLWGKLTQDLQLFVEPRWSYYMYKSMNSNINLAKDQDLSLSLGLTMNLRSRSYREHHDYLFDYDNKLYLGVGGGLNFEYTKGDYEWSGNMYNYNGLAFVGYRINRFHGLRLSVEMASMIQNSIEHSTLWNRTPIDAKDPLIDEAGDLTTMGQYYNNIDLFRQEGFEQWTRDYFVAIPSLSYTLNLTNLFSGYKPGRKTNLDLVFGPSFGFLLGEQHMFFGKYEQVARAEKNYTSDIPWDNYVKDANGYTYFWMYPTLAEDTSAKFAKFGFGAHVGLNLMFNISKNWGMFASPMFYVFGNKFQFSSDEFAHKNRVIMTGNIGLTYTF